MSGKSVYPCKDRQLKDRARYYQIKPLQVETGLVISKELNLRATSHSLTTLMIMTRKKLRCLSQKPGLRAKNKLKIVTRTKKMSHVRGISEGFLGILVDNQSKMTIMLVVKRNQNTKIWIPCLIKLIRKVKKAIKHKIHKILKLVKVTWIRMRLHQVILIVQIHKLK